MIHWFWLLVSFVAGYYLGMLITALFFTNSINKGE